MADRTTVDPATAKAAIHRSYLTASFICRRIGAGPLKTSGLYETRILLVAEAMR